MLYSNMLDDLDLGLGVLRVLRCLGSPAFCELEAIDLDYTPDWF